MICDLLELHQTPIPSDHKKDLNEALFAAANQRDQLAHGIWLREPKSKRLFLRLTKGTWQPIAGQRGKTKRIVMPESVEYGVADARSLRELIDGLRETIDEIATRWEEARNQASQKESG